MLYSRVMNLLLQSLGHIVQLYSASRRALCSVFLSTIVFHALQENLMLCIACKRSSVSAAISAPISTYVGPTTMFGTSTSNYTSWSRSNTSGSITYVWPRHSPPWLATPHHNQYLPSFQCSWMFAKPKLLQWFGGDACFRWSPHMLLKTLEIQQRFSSWICLCMHEDFWNLP